jgi:N-methylhydantoinase A
MAEVQRVFGELGAQARAWLAGEGVAEADQVVTFMADMRYYRQGFELPVDTEGATTLEELADRFRAIHDRLYGFGLPGAVELVNLRARAIGRVTKPEMAATEAAGTDASVARIAEHQGVPLYERELLKPGMEIRGKAIVTQFDATTLILPNHVARVDRHLNLLIEPEAK